MELSPSPKLTPRRSSGPWTQRVLVLVGCVILLDSLVGDRGLAGRLRARGEYADATADLQGLKSQNAALRVEMHRLMADPSAIEAVAREDLGLIRPGEILVIVK